MQVSFGTRRWARSRLQFCHHLAPRVPLRATPEHQASAGLASLSRASTAQTSITTPLGTTHGIQNRSFNSEAPSSQSLHDLPMAKGKNDITHSVMTGQLERQLEEMPIERGEGNIGIIKSKSHFNSHNISQAPLPGHPWKLFQHQYYRENSKQR